MTKETPMNERLEELLGWFEKGLLGSSRHRREFAALIRAQAAELESAKACNPTSSDLDRLAETLGRSVDQQDAVIRELRAALSTATEQLAGARREVEEATRRMDLYKQAGFESDARADALETELAEAREDGARIEYLQKYWSRHGTVFHLPGPGYALWYADWEWDMTQGDKYEHPVGEGATLRIAIDTARAARSGEGDGDGG